MAELKIFDGRPQKEQLFARCKRDKVDPATLQELVVNYTNFKVRCYGRKTTPERTYETNPATGKVEQVLVEAWLLYKTDRQGKINSGWSLPYYGSKISEVVEGFPFSVA